MVVCPEGLLPFFIHKTVPSFYLYLILSLPAGGRVLETSGRERAHRPLDVRLWQVTDIEPAPGKLLLQPQTQSEPQSSA